MTDPIQGKSCVTALQTALHNRGYNQQVTGTFGQQTERNVRDFQGRNNIDAIGIAGPQTQRALFGDKGSDSDLSVPAIPQSSYIADHCSKQECTLRLRRSTTQNYAQRLHDHPFLAAGVTSAILSGACAVVFRVALVVVVCKFVAEGYAAKIQASLAAAAHEHGCLSFTLRLSPAKGQKLVAIGTDNGPRCRD
jgi:peptidoglycan hydrolase-like protein with peptidoglycan-binding domain